MVEEEAKRRLPKADLARVQDYIKSAEWRFASTMPQWPHWYTLRHWGRSDDFDFFEQLIEQYGYVDPWGDMIFPSEIGR